MGEDKSKGKIVYQYRDVINTLTFLLLYLFSRPNFNTLPLSLLLMSIGLILRFLAYGYLGEIGRSFEFQSKILINQGIYKYFKHPIYLGNLFLVSGILVLIDTKWFLKLGVVVGFLIEYGYFALVEEKKLLEAHAEFYQTSYPLIGRYKERKKGFKPLAIKFSLKNCLKELKVVAILLVVIFLLYLKRI